ncbi:hypothetical protein [Candidatus Accumulibacter phosphatis]|nr:hypothetical protein [Candidatus Accumulibacter phosphatis]
MTMIARNLSIIAKPANHPCGIASHHDMWINGFCHHGSSGNDAPLANAAAVFHDEGVRADPHLGADCFRDAFWNGMRVCPVGVRVNGRAFRDQRVFPDQHATGMIDFDPSIDLHPILKAKISVNGLRHQGGVTADQTILTDSDLPWVLYRHAHLDKGIAAQAQHLRLPPPGVYFIPDPLHDPEWQADKREEDTASPQQVGY